MYFMMYFSFNFSIHRRTENCATYIPSSENTYVAGIRLSKHIITSYCVFDPIFLLHYVGYGVKIIVEICYTSREILLAMVTLKPQYNPPTLAS